MATAPVKSPSLPELNDTFSGPDFQHVGIAGSTYPKSLNID